MPDRNRHAFISIIYILSQKTPCIVAADADDHQDQHSKQLVYHSRVQLFVQLSSCHAAANTAKDHDDQPADMELRNAGSNNTCQQTGDLRNQNDVQAVLGCLLGFHGEEEIQHHQIDGATANAEETGHDAQGQIHRNADQRILHLHGFDVLLVQRVYKGCCGNNGKTHCLIAAHPFRLCRHGTEHGDRFLPRIPPMAAPMARGVPVWNFTKLSFAANAFTTE